MSFIKVTVYPEFKKELVEKLSEDSYKIYIRQAPERGQANKRVLEILQNLYPQKRIRLVNGHTHMKKLFDII
jgi:uncharacterized protein YggU (UPF0235/DUF167 family)